MDILQVSTSFNIAKLGGAERMVYYLASHLKKAGHRVAILTCEDSKNFDDIECITIPKPLDLTSVYGLSPISIFSLFNLKLIFRLCKTFKDFEIIHFHNIHSYTLTLYGMIAAKLLRKKIVWTPHDYWFCCPKQTLLTEDEKICTSKSCYLKCTSASLLRKLFSIRHIITKLLKHVDKALPPSNYVSDRVLSFGMNRSRITIVYNGVQIVTPPEHPPEGNNILFVGRIDRRKGTYCLLESIKKVKTRSPDIQVKYVGEGPERRNLEKLRKEWALQDNVTFTGRISNEELENAYASARIIIVPSLWPEVFGLAAAEAMVRQRPVIASDVGALPEVIQNNQTGLLFKHNNPNQLAKKIIYLLSNEELLTKFGENGRKIARIKFNIHKYSRAIEDIYRQMLNAKFSEGKS